MLINENKNPINIFININVKIDNSFNMDLSINDCNIHVNPAKNE